MSQSRSATSATMLTGRGNLGAKLLTAACLALWAVVILLPLLTLCIQALQPTAQTETAGSVAASLFRSLGLAAVIAAAAVVLGYAPGRLLGTCRAHSDLLLLLLLMPLVLPRYVLYYAWTLLLSPTTQLGAYLGSRPELARLVGALSSSLVMVSWYWPLAALLIAQGWRNVDRQILDCASIDGGRVRMFSGVTLPLLLPALCLAFAVCMVLSLSEFATFHLAGVQTIGTELAVLYQMTGSESSVARAAWPMILPALILAVLLGRSTPSWTSSAAPLDAAESAPQRLRWCIFLALIGISLVAPLVLLIANVTDIGQLRQFLALHLDQLGWSLLIAAVAAVLVHLIAFGAMSLETVVVSGPAYAPGRAFGARRILSLVVRSTILLAMFLPASLLAVSLLKMLVMFKVPPVVRQGWYVVSAGQAAQFAGAALILFLLVRRSEHRQLSEMACSDGASPLTAWRYVHLPRYWPILVGSFILVLMLCMTELSATMVLLPAGVPSFAQWLLNQMHYVRDQHVIASCLMLVCLFVVLAAVFVLLMRVARLRRQVATLLLVVCMFTVTGCERRPVTPDGSQARQTGIESDVRVLYSFGRTGRGRSEFIYPRAIDLTAEGSLFVVDKTGRIQRLTREGDFQLVFNMPYIEAGKPTGISIGPDSNLYVADTHCHRVVVFSPEGDLIRQFGTFGQDKGCFIYPTDVAFAPDGTIFVSEYGGNDRVSVFTEKGDFLHSFGSPGSGDNQFSRPSALCVDKSRRRLYIADACNQRIAVYDLGGNLQGYIGAAGRGPGQLRYPYDLALLADGTLVVCEFGNNRLQLFNTDGDSVALYGGPGRQLGRLAYPWGVAVDQSGRAFVVDAGNNRIQIWQL